MSAEEKKPFDRELIMAYVDAWREEQRAEKALLDATNAREAARWKRQEAWRKVAARRNEGSIKEGVYRVGRQGSSHEEGLLITGGDYPDVFDMFDAHPEAYR